MMTPAEIAKECSLSTRTVVRMCGSGEIPAYKVGRQ